MRLALNAGTVTAQVDNERSPRNGSYSCLVKSLALGRFAMIDIFFVTL